MRAKHLIFAAIPSLLGLIVLLAAWRQLEPAKSSEQKGKELNERAWEAAYLERNLSVPAEGPRDGWGSARLMPRLQDSRYGWIEREQHVAGAIDIDATGAQFWQSTTPPKFRILIVGASVALGVSASSIDTTYFAVAGRQLEADGMPVEIKIHAAGAWKTVQELEVLKDDLAANSFDVVAMLDGMNDLTLGKDAAGLFEHGESGKFRVTLDFEERVARYFNSVNEAADLCHAARCKLLVVLQPSLFEKQNPTSIERALDRATFPGQSDIGALFSAPYDRLRSGLASLEVSGRIDFLDASRLMNAEAKTTFTDSCHLSDPGQAILGKALAAELKRLLEAVP